MFLAFADKLIACVCGLPHVVEAYVAQRCPPPRGDVHVNTLSAVSIGGTVLGEFTAWHGFGMAIALRNNLVYSPASYGACWHGGATSESELVSPAAPVDAGCVPSWSQRCGLWRAFRTSGLRSLAPQKSSVCLRSNSVSRRRTHWLHPRPPTAWCPISPTSSTRRSRHRRRSPTDSRTRTHIAAHGRRRDRML